MIQNKVNRICYTNTYLFNLNLVIKYCQGYIVEDGILHNKKYLTIVKINKYIIPLHI